MKKIVTILILSSMSLFFASRVSALSENELVSSLSHIKNIQVKVPATAYLMETLVKAIKSYGTISDYQTKFYKTEKTKGILGPTEEIFVKFEKTFKIYMCWLNTDKKGVEVVYERGKRKGKLAVHKPGLLLGLAPVIMLDQDSPWIKEGSASYNIEDAGIGTFLDDFAKDVIKAAEENNLEVKYLGRSQDEDLNGDKIEVTFLNTKAGSGYMAYRTDVLFDKLTSLPVKMELFDWQNKPMGVYAYKDLRINVGSDDPSFKNQINRHLLKIYLQ